MSQSGLFHHPRTVPTSREHQRLQQHWGSQPVPAQKHELRRGDLYLDVGLKWRKNGGVRLALAQLRHLISLTDNGLDRIVRFDSRHGIRLALWIAVYTVLTVALIYLCNLSMANYAEFPVSTSIRVGNETFVRLPRIAFCNINPFKRDELCVPPYSVLCEPGQDLASVLSNFTIPRPTAAANETANATSPDDADNSESIEKHLTTAFYSIEDLVVSCSILGKPCAANLSDFFEPLIIDVFRHGRCFCMFCTKRTHNDRRRIVNLTDVPERGVVLLLNTRTETYLPSSRGTGFIIAFYSGRDDTTKPDFNRDGIHAPNSATSYMSLSVKEQYLLPSPYPSQCGTNWPSGYLSEIRELGNKSYSHEDCIRICIHLQVINECECKPTKRFHALVGADSICGDTAATTECRNRQLGNPLAYRKNCHCPVECRKKQFFIETSRATFQALGRLAFNQSRTKNMTKVVIYYNAVEAMLSEEAPAFTFLMALTAVGGNMNTFTGLSFLLLFEFADVLASWIYLIFFDKRKSASVQPLGQGSFRN